jgi:hypothetical protein
MTRRSVPKTTREPAWATLPDEALLELPIQDLHLTVEGTWLEGCLTTLHAELAERDLVVRPHAWISNEWFSPSNTPGIAFPFYLAHPRLMRLERKMMREVEGGTRAECMRILRHEAGHVVQHAYQLHDRPGWQELFGRSSSPYPSHYRPNPASRNYVQHLKLWYAQSHPDEDFAETFAVWFARRSNWRKRYAGWPALKKLEYVDELMGEIAGKRPVLRRRLDIDPIGKLKGTIGDHYAKKLEHYRVQPPTTYDRDLKRIFSTAPHHRDARPAAAFIRGNRAKIRRLVSKWTGEYELNLDTVLDDMIKRSRDLKLRAVGSEAKMQADLTVQLTAKIVRSMYSPSRRQWFAL